MAKYKGKNAEVARLLQTLVPVWQKCRSTRQLWRKTIKTLKGIRSFPAQVLANQMILVYRMLSGKNIVELKRLFGELRRHIIAYCREWQIPVDVSWRQKSFLSMMMKFFLFISKGKPLSTLNDVFGCRFVVGDENTSEIDAVIWCYVVMNEILGFCAYKLNATLILAETPNGATLSKEDARKKGFYVPPSSLILEGCRNNVKDYIRNVKVSGYRALHAAVRFPSGLVIEFQIRSFQMHEFAEKDSMANHDAYKEHRYGMPLVPEGLNLEEFHVRGFNYKKGIDKAGILHSKGNFGI